MCIRDSDYPLTVLYLVVFVNITNLIDGLDGLASGLVAIVAGGLLYLVLMRGSFTLVPVSYTHLSRSRAASGSTALRSASTK